MILCFRALVLIKDLVQIPVPHFGIQLFVTTVPVDLITFFWPLLAAPIHIGCTHAFRSILIYIKNKVLKNFPKAKITCHFIGNRILRGKTI